MTLGTTLWLIGIGYLVLVFKSVLTLAGRATGVGRHHGDVSLPWNCKWNDECSFPVQSVHYFYPMNKKTSCSDLRSKTPACEPRWPQLNKSMDFPSPPPFAALKYDQFAEPLKEGKYLNCQWFSNCSPWDSRAGILTKTSNDVLPIHST